MKKLLITSTLLALLPTMVMAKDYKNEHEVDGSIAAGLDWYEGNTDKLNYNLDTRIDHTYGRWGNVLEGNALNTSDSSIRSGEKYRAAWQPRYELSDRDYLFGEAEYIKDRFSGYKYRMNGLLGYGRIFIDNDSVIKGGDHVFWSGEASLGARQSEDDLGIEETDFIQRLATRFVWDINDRVTFIEDANYTFGDSFDEAHSKTNLKVKMSDKLFLNLGYDIDWISDVPAGTENTDQHGYVQLGYDF